MSQHQPAPEGKDPVLWELAEKRASFKKHALSYVGVNALLWIIWYITGGSHFHIDAGEDDFMFNIPWPLWTTLGWGIGLASHFAAAYLFHETNSVEREYEKLKNKK